MKWKLTLASILYVALVASMPRLMSAQEMPTDDVSEAADQMHEHLDRITTIKSHIVIGNLDGVRQTAKWMVNLERMANLPAIYEPFIAFMRSSARQLVNAEDLSFAVTSVSLMAQNCGNCHVAAKLNLEFGYDQVPAEWSDDETHMQRHQWAIDRLWEGLIGPSDSAWNRGTAMLAESPLRTTDIMDNTSAADAATLDGLARRVHDLGAEGSGARALNARSQIYGEILSLCADCHTRSGRGPGR
jgi:hypothetical protein